MQGGSAFEACERGVDTALEGWHTLNPIWGCGPSWRRGEPRWMECLAAHNLPRGCSTPLIGGHPGGRPLFVCAPISVRRFMAWCGGYLCTQYRLCLGR